MSKLIATAAIRGAHAAVERADTLLREALLRKNETHPVAFPNTAYFLPLSYSHLGFEVKTLGEMSAVLAHAKRLLPPLPYERVWLPYLGPALNAGMSTLLAFEIIEACRTVSGPPPHQGIWLGAADDVIMRERGIDGRQARARTAEQKPVCVHGRPRGRRFVR
jgi:acetyl-CoA synthase